MGDLPRPVTTADKYLANLADNVASVLDELQAIRAQLIQPEPEEDGEIELKEPAQVYTPLPDDFPGYDALVEDGIIYLENVPRKGVELVTIPGIGNATANKILTWFVS
jgi:hypothetical protein